MGWAFLALEALKLVVSLFRKKDRLSPRDQYILEENSKKKNQ
jgi:hypothetical protein